MSTNTRFFNQLFKREPDSRYATFDELYTEMLKEKDNSSVLWKPPANMYATTHQNQLKLKITGDRAYDLTDWSFGQLCTYVGADRKIIERLQLETASQVLSEIFPFGDRPLQLFTTGQTIRSLHRISYERLFNADLLDVVLDEAMDLTGKYNERSESMGFFAGDRDMFAYLVDESSWTHYWGERFAPAFVVYNSEVGGRSVGIRSGWYHSGSKGFMLNGDSCSITYSRRHSIRVKDSLEQIRDRIGLWLTVAEAQSDILMKQLAEARREMFAHSNSSMQKKLVACGISTEHAKAIDKWLVTEGRSFSRLDVAIAISAVSSSLPFASTRFELGQFSGKLLQHSVSESNSLPLQQA